MSSSDIKFFTIDEVAEKLGLCRAAVYKNINRGGLVITKFGGATRISSADLDAFIAAGRRPRSKAA
jgi:excisionase family DNA binding protein